MADEIKNDLAYETGDSLECSITDVGCIGQWFADLFTSFGLWLYEKLINGIVAVIEMIPVPEFLENASSLRIPDGLGFVAEVFHLEMGAQIIVSAFVLRFIIRRLPIVG